MSLRSKVAVSRTDSSFVCAGDAGCTDEELNKAHEVINSQHQCAFLIVLVNFILLAYRTPLDKH